MYAQFIYAVLLSHNRNIINVSHQTSPGFIKWCNSIVSVGAFFSGIIFMQVSEVSDFA